MSKTHWFGKEIEGRWYGVETLCLAQEFEACQNLFVKVPHVLIGVELIDQIIQKQTSHIGWDDIIKWMDDTNKMFTLECKPHQVADLPIMIKLRCHILLWIDCPELAELKASDSIKICPQSHDMYVYTLFHGQRVTRQDYIHDRH